MMAVEFLQLIVSLLPLIVPFSVYVLIGIISLCLYIKLKRTGFMLIGIGFLANAVAPLARIALGGPFLTLRLVESGLSDFQIGQFLFYVTLVDWAFLAIFAVLVSVDLFQLGKRNADACTTTIVTTLKNSKNTTEPPIQNG